MKKIPKNRSLHSLVAVITVVAMLFSMVGFITLLPQNVLANDKANLDQGSNGTVAVPISPVDWVNGNLNENKAHLMEGFSVPYRITMTDLTIGTPVTLTIGYDVINSSKHAIDYLTYYQRLEPHAGFGHATETVNPLAGVTGVSATVDTFPIPAPSSVGSLMSGQPTSDFNSLPAGERVMTLFGGDITAMAYVSQGDLTAAQSETTISITFTPDSATAVLAWGGHIATSAV
jgi:hypothetical protein